MGQDNITPVDRSVIAGSRSSEESLPGLQWVNRGVNALKQKMNDGRGLTLKKAGIYLGYRLISYSLVPTIANLISLIACTILGIVTLPLRCCVPKLNNWCWNHALGSLKNLGRSLFDLTCDFRQLTGRCCCNPKSLYVRI